MYPPYPPQDLRPCLRAYGPSRQSRQSRPRSCTSMQWSKLSFDGHDHQGHGLGHQGQAQGCRCEGCHFQDHQSHGEGHKGQCQCHQGHDKVHEGHGQGLQCHIQGPQGHGEDQ